MKAKIALGIMLALLLMGILTSAFDIQPIRTELQETKATLLSSGFSWPMFRHDVEHTGETEEPGPVTNRTVWIQNVGSSVTSSPAVVNGRVYIASNRGVDLGYINCLDEMNGTVLWSSPLAGMNNYSSPAFGTPVGGADMVFIGTNQYWTFPPRGYVQAFNAKTGAPVWTAETGQIESSPTFSRIYSMVFVGSINGKVYSLDALTGSVLWSNATGGPVRSSPAVDESQGLIIVGSDDHRVYALNINTGHVMWNFTTGAAVQSSPALGVWAEDLLLGLFHDVVFVGSNDGNICMLNRTSGARLANYTTGGRVRSSPTLWSAYSDAQRFTDKLFVGSDDNQVRMLSVNVSGTPGLSLSWNYSTGSSVESSPAKAPAIPDYPVAPMIYVGSNDGKVYSFDETGSVIWSYQTGGPVKSSPAVDEGWVFVGSSDGHVYAFGTMMNVDTIAVWQHETNAKEAFDIWYSIWDDNTKSWWTPTGAEAAPIVHPFFITPAAQPGGQDDMDANIAFDRKGNSIAVWAHGSLLPWGYCYQIYYSRLPYQWSHPFGWASPKKAFWIGVDVNDTDPAIAFDDNGWAIAVWIREFLNGTKVVFNRLWNGTDWIGVEEPLVPLPDNWPGNASLPEITFTSNETSGPGLTPHQAVAMWTDWNKTAAQFRTYYAIWNGQNWTDAAGAYSVEEIPGQTVNAALNGIPATFRNAISSDRLGNANAVWATDSLTGQLHHSIWNGSSWTDAAAIPASEGYMPAIAYNWTSHATLAYTGPGSTLNIHNYLYDSTTRTWTYGGVAADSGAADMRSAIAFLDADTTLTVWWAGSAPTAEIGYSLWNGLAWSAAMPIVSPGLPYPDLNPAIASRSGSSSAPPVFHTLKIAAAVGGTTNPSLGTYTYVPGTRKSVAAMPDLWSTFDHWELDGVNVGTNNPITVTIDADHTLRAVFIHDWPMFRHDSTHSGYSPSPAANTNATLWNYTTGSYVYSSPAVVEGRVFIGAYDNKTYALNASDGTHLWNFTTGLVIYSSPSVAEGRVFVASRDRKIYALNASTGAHIWNYTTLGEIWSSPVVACGRVYIGSDDYRVYALNASTGVQLWNYTTSWYVRSSPAVADGRVFVGSYDGRVYALNATDGTFNWSYKTGGVVFSSPAAVNGIVYVGSRDNKIYALNVSTGVHLWNYTTENQVESSPAVAYGMVFVGSRDGHVYALNSSTGNQIWNYTTGGVVNSSPAVADGKVFVGSHDNKVYAFNATTGALIWSYRTIGLVESSPAVSDGKVFIGSGDGKVYAFGYKHDIAITNITLSKTIVGQGYAMNINVTVQNQGNVIESFDVTAYHSNSSFTGAIATQNVTVTGGSFTSLTFTWNTTGFVKGNYTIKAYAWPVPGETDTGDNIYIDGVVWVKWPYDVTGDNYCGIEDIVAVAEHFGTMPGGPPNSLGLYYGPIYDVNCDDYVGIDDIVATAEHFAQSDP